MTRTTEPPKSDQPDEGAVPIAVHVTTAPEAIKASSLLARRPELRDALLTPQQWDAAIAKDQATPTD